MTHTVIGLFDDRTQAHTARQELIQKGFIQDNVDVSNRRMSDTNTASTTVNTTGTGVGDSISNFFSSLFSGDETTARNYTNAASDADAILTVHVDSDARAREAAEILDRNGATDVDGHSSQSNQQNVVRTSTSTQNTAPTQNAATMPNTANRTGEATIPIIEEQMQVGKREVEGGGAHIRSRIIEKPVEASVRLREEHVVVNRRPVNREVTNSDLTSFKEGDIELTERAEVAVVDKQARVVEEVVVGKNVTEHQETVRDTVRRTDVDVEKIDNNVTQADVNNRKANN